MKLDEKSPLSIGMSTNGVGRGNYTHSRGKGQYEPIASNPDESLGSTDKSNKKYMWPVLGALLFGGVLSIIILLATKDAVGAEVGRANDMMQGAAWSSKADPISTVNPEALGLKIAERPDSTKPGAIFSRFLRGGDIPFPTNGWYENLFIGDINTDPANKVFQVPYIVDTAGFIQGVRTHPSVLEASNRAIMMIYKEDDGLSLGADEEFDQQHYIRPQETETGAIVAATKLAIELEWVSSDYKATGVGPSMRSAIVRGSPYTSMKYIDAKPRIFIPRAVSKGIPIVIDGDESKVMQCGEGGGKYSEEPVMVHRELKVTFDTSDMTWLIFVSHPTPFVCSTFNPPPVDLSKLNLPPGVVPPVEERSIEKGNMAYFDLKATRRMDVGMVRVSMSNNCTTGQDPIHCAVFNKPNDNHVLEKLLRDHADVYPTARADVEFTFPVEASVEEELRLNFNWHPALMSMLGEGLTDGNGNSISATGTLANSSKGSDVLVDTETRSIISSANEGGVVHKGERRVVFESEQNVGPFRVDVTTSDIVVAEEGEGEGEEQNAVGRLPRVELLMFALPHHQHSAHFTSDSSNMVVEAATCLPTIMGFACPILGSMWSMVENLHRTSFFAESNIKQEMVADIKEALKEDIHFEIPKNYQIGAGDTYFSGKLLAKLARILLVAEEVGGVSEKDFFSAVERLRAGVEIWINGSAESPFLYDRYWGGLVMCGCDYDAGRCKNKYPDCPALTDVGQNFGAGFYNDHHFHYGYHIYAAAVVARYDKAWGRKYFEHVMLLVRDIANPSDADSYFTTWRHKDWFSGHSWANGIVTLGGKPYPNGRNQESSSEAIAAYEAVALFGDSMASIFGESEGSSNPLVPKRLRMRGNGGSSGDSSKKRGNGFFGSVSSASGSSQGSDWSWEEDQRLLDACLRLRDLGRLLLTTEIASTRTYWHVQSAGDPDAPRVYPEVYQPKVVGMLWSLLAQEQTWFGAEEWKSYGIQLMPITPISEQRDEGAWTKEMLPFFKKSCDNDPGCGPGGWSILVFTSMATAGEWREAWEGVTALDDDVFYSAGGNGHSLSNTLWYIATRPEEE